MDIVVHQLLDHFVVELVDLLHATVEADEVTLGRAVRLEFVLEVTPKKVDIGEVLLPGKNLRINSRFTIRD